MQEIKSPKCGEVFRVDESGHAAIIFRASGLDESRSGRKRVGEKLNNGLAMNPEDFEVRWTSD